jgi:hypothetical protein
VQEHAQWFLAATYILAFLGALLWGKYYRASLNRAAKEKRNLEAADAAFRKQLGLSDTEESAAEELSHPSAAPPDYRQTLQDAWQRVMDSGNSHVVSYDIDGNSSLHEESGYGVLHVGTNFPGRVTPDPIQQQSDPRNHYPLTNPRLSAAEVLNKCAEEIEIEEAPITFKVFEAPHTMVRGEEPPEVLRIYEKYLRNRSAPSSNPA